jgi:uncharacterized protein with ATP-grasp and redox domains
MAGADDHQQKEILDDVLESLRQIRNGCTPPEIAYYVHRTVRRVVGNGDPYRTIKQSSTKEALSLYSMLESMVAGADDPFDMALRLSIAGNIIDLGPDHTYDLEEVIHRVAIQPFAIDHTAALRTRLNNVDSVLYLADNTGETVFDKLLIKKIDLPVYYAVKAGPILNDATAQDAVEAGLDEVAQIISTGSDAPGTVLDLCSPEFRTLFKGAGLIIAKGQANYETLSDHGSNLYSLLQVKCKVIARDLSVPLGSIIAKQGKNKKG